MPKWSAKPAGSATAQSSATPATKSLLGGKATPAPKASSPGGKGVIRTIEKKKFAPAMHGPRQPMLPPQKGHEPKQPAEPPAGMLPVGKVHQGPKQPSGPPQKGGKAVGKGAAAGSSQK